MSTSLQIKGTVNLPVIGEKELTIKENLNGLEGDIAQAVIESSGGTVGAKAAITSTDEGIHVKVTAELPGVGEKVFELDEPLSGLEKAVIDELLTLDGGELDITVEVSEVADETQTPPETA